MARTLALFALLIPACLALTAGPAGAQTTADASAAESVTLGEGDVEGGPVVLPFDGEDVQPPALIGSRDAPPGLLDDVGSDDPGTAAVGEDRQTIAAGGAHQGERLDGVEQLLEAAHAKDTGPLEGGIVDGIRAGKGTGV